MLRVFTTLFLAILRSLITDLLWWGEISSFSRQSLTETEKLVVVIGHLIELIEVLISPILHIVVLLLVFVFVALSAALLIKSELFKFIVLGIFLSVTVKYVTLVTIVRMGTLSSEKSTATGGRPMVDSVLAVTITAITVLRSF